MVLQIWVTWSNGRGWSVFKEDLILSWPLRPKQKSMQAFLPPASFVCTQAKRGAYLLHRSAYEIRSDMSACQAHKHNKLRRQQWKKSPASVHGLQTATSISVKTNSSKPLSLEHGLRVWRDVRKKDKNSQGLLRVSLTTLHFHKEKCPNIFKWAGR